MYSEMRMTSSAPDSRSEEGVRASGWNAVLSLTREMLDAARSGNWDHVLRLEPVRRERIERFFAEGIAAHETGLVRTGIIDILSADEELLRLSRGYEQRLPANVIPFRRPASARRS